jgi:non-ribosomal peptide synthetase component F
MQWQEQYLHSPTGQADWYYWQSKLRGKLPLLNLPTTYARPPIQTYNGASYIFKLDLELTAKLKALAVRQEVTLYTLLLAAFFVLIHFLSNQSDILIGSLTVGRDKPEFASVVGYFSNPIVLRCNLDDNPSFINFLAQVRTTVLEGISHQSFPFPLLVERLQPERDASRSPLFQVLFLLQKSQQKLGEWLEFIARDGNRTPLTWGGLNLESFDMPQQEGQFDFELEMVETAAALVGAFQYNQDLFDQGTIERFSQYFQTLLNSIVQAPDSTLANLVWLPEAERQQLLFEWNQTQTDYPKNQCTHQLFEAQVRLTPHRIAVEFQDQTLTYQALNRRANQLAHYLQKQGVGPGTLVGMGVDRSLNVPIIVLAILKAGGVYVPLDPTYPAERLAYVLADASIAYLVTQETLVPKFLDARADAQATIICLDSQGQMIDQEGEFNLVNLTKPQDLAYVIYTSGSTGQPKGVMIEHRGLLNHLYGMITSLNLEPTDMIAQTAPLGFDISIWQILTALIIGGTTCVLDNGVTHSPIELLKQVQMEKISVLQIVPSLLRVMIEMLESQTIKGETIQNQGHQSLPQLSLKWLLITGEGFPRDLCDWWVSHYPMIPLVNAYGPAECSDDVTLHFIKS